MVGVIKVNMCTLHKEGHHYKDDILDRSNKIAASIGLDLAMKDFELGKSDKAAMRYLFRTWSHDHGKKTSDADVLGWDKGTERAVLLLP